MVKGGADDADSSQVSDHPRETAGVTTRLIVTVLRRRGGDGLVERVLRRAGETRPVEVLEDEGSWTSYDRKVDLFAAAAVETGDPAIARSIGEQVLEASVGGSTRGLLELLGSPRQVLRSVAKANAKFSTTATMSAPHIGRHDARITYRLHDGFEPSRHDCLYTQGILSQAPVLFGLPPARIEHPACQVEGAPECVYQLTWRPRGRWWQRRRRGLALEQQEAARRQLADLQRTVADLVADADVDTILERIADRSTTAVQAQRYLLAVEVPGEPAPRYLGEGLTDDQTVTMGEDLLRDRPLGTSGSVLVSEVASGRRSYGRLAAVYDQPALFFEYEQELLDAYGQLAAAALDVATSLDLSRRRGRTSQLLLDVARDLAGARRAEDAARTIAEVVPELVGADRVGVLLYDERLDELHIAGLHGWPEHLQPSVEAYRLAPDDTPAFADLLGAPGPQLHGRDSPDPYIRTTLERFEVDTVAAVPIEGGDGLLGVVLACWSSEAGPPQVGGQFWSRLRGLADLAVTSLANARLVEAVQHQATHDTLTGLPNRELFHDRLDQALARWHREGSPFAVVFVDLDRFKGVNDEFGHAVGDALLRQVGERLRSILRDVDTLARVGGDEFTLILGDVGDEETVTPVAARILEVFARPFDPDGNELLVSPSFGVAIVGQHGTDRDELTAAADAAMYRAKQAGRNTWRLAASERTGGAGGLRVEHALRRALEREELVLVYQPQVDLRSGRTVGLEALVRWHHPERGVLAPRDFLPVAEESDLITAIDLRVLELASRQMRGWLEEGVRPVRVAVNVTARTFAQPRFLQAVDTALEVAGSPSRWLELELTELAALHDTGEMVAIIDRLRERGCSLAVDDVGTGYSTLARLRDLPVDRLKVEGSFVSGMPGDLQGTAVVEAIVALGHRLGRRAHAEGVDTTAQRDAGVATGCDEAQGFLFGEPRPAPEVARELLQAGSAHPLD